MAGKWDKYKISATSTVEPEAPSESGNKWDKYKISSVKSEKLPQEQSLMQKLPSIIQRGLPSPTDVITTIPGVNMYRAGQQLSEGIKEQAKQTTGMTGIMGDILLSPETYATTPGLFRVAKTGISAIAKPVQTYRAMGKALGEMGAEWKGLPASEIPRKLAEKANLVKSQLAQHEDDFKTALKSFSDEGAIGAKPKIKTFGENLTKSYDTKIDAVDDILTKSDIPINVTQFDVAKDWLEPAVNKVSGNPREQLRLINSVKKLGYNVESGLMADESGNIVYSITPRESEALVSFRNLIDHKNEISALGGNASSAAKHSFVDFLSDEARFPFNVSQTYKEMQSAYGPLANAKWEAYKIFKPFDKANIDTKAASAFFEKVARGTLEENKKRLLNIIEQGSEFSPGTGDISSTMSKWGLGKRQTGKELARQAEDLMSQNKLAQDYIAKRGKMASDAAWLVGKLGLGSAAVEAGRRLVNR